MCLSLAKDIPLLPGYLSSLFSIAHGLAQRLWSYDLMALYKYVYYYYYCIIIIINMFDARTRHAYLAMCR